MESLSILEWLCVRVSWSKSYWSVTFPFLMISKERDVINETKTLSLTWNSLIQLRLLPQIRI